MIASSSCVRMLARGLWPSSSTPMRHADIADHGAGTRTADSLRHRLFRAHALQNGIRADSVGQRLDPIDAPIAALGDDVGRAEFESEVLPCLVAAHHDDPAYGRACRETDGRRASTLGRQPLRWPQ